MASGNKKHDALLDELLKDYTDPKDILGAHGLLRQLTKRVVERALEAELTAHLGYEPHARNGSSPGNCRNGKGKKTVQTETAQFDIEVPRDRDGSFEPQLVHKRQRRLEGFDDKVLALYARGLSTREIQDHLEELYGVEVSPTLISNVTDAVLDEVRTWQARPLASVYPILYFPLNLSGWTTWKVGFKLTSTTFVRLSTLRGALESLRNGEQHLDFTCCAGI